MSTMIVLYACLPGRHLPLHSEFIEGCQVSRSNDPPDFRQQLKLIRIGDVVTEIKGMRDYQHNIIGSLQVASKRESIDMSAAIRSHCVKMQHTKRTNTQMNIEMNPSCPHLFCRVQELKQRCDEVFNRETMVLVLVDVVAEGCKLVWGEDRPCHLPKYPFPRHHSVLFLVHDLCTGTSREYLYECVHTLYNVYRGDYHSTTVKRRYLARSRRKPGN